MATLTPLSIKSAARKLPIKRKNLPQPQTQSFSYSQPIPITIVHPNPNPNTTPLSSLNPYEDDPDAEYEDDEPEDEAFDSKQQPFKFHRIWPESDEIRFLQGLLGCWSQGLVFPRDLNIFYDRFSESMSQPYTRSQLSEKLRRLRKKYRTMDGRISRGHDASRLSQHDRDLLHLSTRLWDPSNALTSPFSALDAISSGSAGNKRRRPNPRALTSLARASSAPPQVIVALESAPFSIPKLNFTFPTPVSSVDDIKECLYFSSFGNNGLMNEDEVAASRETTKEELRSLPAGSSEGVNMSTEVKHFAIRSVLNVLDGVLMEVRSKLANTFEQNPEMKNMSKRWQEHRLAELDVLAQRWRLVFEQKSTQI